MTAIFKTRDPRFLDLVLRTVVHVSMKTGRPVGIGWLAKRLAAPAEDVEAAMVHLVNRGELKWERHKRKKP